MSIQHVSWVLNHSAAAHGHRLVLLSIANHANENDEAHPSEECIAYETAMSISQVRRTILELVKAGRVQRTINGAPDQRIRADRRPNLYRLVMNDERVSWQTQRDSRVRQIRAPVEPLTTANGCADSASTATPKPRTEPSVEPSVKERVVATPTTPSEIPALCAQLASRWSQHSGQPKPATTGKAWTEPMRLLLERGQPSWAEPEAIQPARVARVVNGIFDRLAVPDRNGFCWADQIRSPRSLREHWDQLIPALNGHLRHAENDWMDRSTGRPPE